MASSDESYDPLHDRDEDGYEHDSDPGAYSEPDTEGYITGGTTGTEGEDDSEFFEEGANPLDLVAQLGEQDAGATTMQPIMLMQQRKHRKGGGAQVGVVMAEGGAAEHAASCCTCMPLHAARAMQCFSAASMAPPPARLKCMWHD